MTKKYEILTDKTIMHGDIKLYRIRAIKDFGDVKAGDIGGFIQSEANLQQKGLAWVYDDAMVFGDAWVLGDAQVRGEAKVSGNAVVWGNARVCDKTLVFNNSQVSGNAEIKGNSLIY